MLVDGKTDAFATDDILLYGPIARHRSQERFRVTGDYLSYDPYAIMFRKGEPQLAAVVERTFRKLGSNHDLIPLYDKWFEARLPTGERLKVAISPQFEDAFKVLDDTKRANNQERCSGWVGSWPRMPMASWFETRRCRAMRGLRRVKVTTSSCQDRVDGCPLPVGPLAKKVRAWVDSAESRPASAVPDETSRLWSICGG